ncbi:MAG: phage SIOphi [Pseudomonadota bacterium]|jgi:hypothetical protein
MERKEIIAAIENMCSEDLFMLNNIFCDVMSCYDDQIFGNDEEFFNMFFEGKPMEAARAAVFGDYNFHHEYVKFNGYGNLESFDFIGIENLPDSLDRIVDAIEESFNAFEDLF